MLTSVTKRQFMEIIEKFPKNVKRKSFLNIHFSGSEWFDNEKLIAKDNYNRVTCRTTYLVEDTYEPANTL